MKRKVRKEASVEFHHAIIEASYNAIETATDPFANCLNCLNFNENKEICNLYNQRPPARVIAYGCPQWIDIMETPF
jgi:hypothetical protein